jgi:hypothetical protein
VLFALPILFVRLLLVRLLRLDGAICFNRRVRLSELPLFPLLFVRDGILH